MKMIQAMVRPEKEVAISYALAKANFPALTKWDVVGRGKQMGIHVGSQLYDELSKTFFLIVVEDEQVDSVLAIFQSVGATGVPGDGKIFISEVESAYTVRTGLAQL